MLSLFKLSEDDINIILNHIIYTLLFIKCLSKIKLRKMSMQGSAVIMLMDVLIWLVSMDVHLEIVGQKDINMISVFLRKGRKLTKPNSEDKIIQKQFIRSKNNVIYEHNIHLSTFELLILKLRYFYNHDCKL